MGLVINYVRCGVEKYTSGSWTMLAGEENTDFTKYVTNRDAANGTTAGALRARRSLPCPMGTRWTLCICSAVWTSPTTP